MKKLELKDLKVESFITADQAAQSIGGADTNPTPNTWCLVCPVTIARTCSAEHTCQYTDACSDACSGADPC